MTHSSINLHTIFRSLVQDKGFLSNSVEIKKKEKKRKISKNVIKEHEILEPFETEEYNAFPSLMKKYLNHRYVRLGIKNSLERNGVNVNISFLSSLNILIRPELQKVVSEEQVQNFQLLEDMIKHKIRCNFQIDEGKKNTKKVQQINAELIKLLVDGKINKELIQYISNIFEINLLIFDLINMTPIFYWCHGEKYPYFNPFKKVFCMTVVNDYYEPVICSSKYSDKINRKIYSKILENIKEIQFPMKKLQLGLFTIFYIETWNLNRKQLLSIHKIYTKRLFEETKNYKFIN
jgi:hypothetical protein